MRIMIKGGVWKNTEDEILKAAVMKYGKNQWARISSLLVRKSAKQCKARWYEWLDPSIKKSSNFPFQVLFSVSSAEWTREEDEKLLHLAKLMPTQWRTIAPIVGRTPSQCLERYEKLLDAACAKDENYEPNDDPRKLRPGEIDPNPESKPARPDPVDMDEDEKEMLSEARARLANTRGKKAKRKAREKQLEEARRLASLQKRRELKAAGIDNRHRRRKRKGIDYNAEIPFEKRPPPGFFDVSGEEKPAEQHKFPTTIEELEGKRRVDIETQLRRQDAARNKIQQRLDSPAAILQANKLNDPAAVRKRSKLMLPPPQISDQELEEIAKMGYASDLTSGNEELAEGSGATRALVADYSQTPRRGMTPLRTPQRTPAGKVDAIMMEAENLARLRESQTPLLGGENPELHPSDFSGVTPRKREMQTPNPLATPLSSPGPAGLTPRIGMTPSRDGPGGTPKFTPFRDDLHINEDVEMQDSAKLELRRQEEMRRNLRSGLTNLPLPKNEYQIVMQPIPEENEEIEEKIEEDMSDKIAKDKAREQARMEALMKKRSKVLQRELPRPPAASLELIKNLLVKGDEDKSSFVPPTPFEQADEMINKELLSLLEHDNAKYPLNEKSDKVKVKGVKRAENGKSSNSIPEIEEFDEAELTIPHSVQPHRTLQFSKLTGTELLIPSIFLLWFLGNLKINQRSLKYYFIANSLIKEEMKFLRVAMGHENESFDDFVKARDACQEDLMFFPARNTYGLASVAGSSEKLAALQNEFEIVKKKMDDEAKKATRLEQKIKVLTHGYQMRGEKLWSQIEATFKLTGTASIELECFQALQKQERAAASYRIDNLIDEVNKQKQLERTLQDRYRDLLVEEERIQRMLEEHKARLQAEEEMAASIRAAEEEMAARKRAEEETAASIRAAEEEMAARKRAEEETAASIRAAEEEMAARKRAEEETAASIRAAEDEMTARKPVEEEMAASICAAEDEMAASICAAEDEMAARKRAEEEMAASICAAEDEMAARNRAEDEMAASILAAEDEMAARKLAEDEMAASIHAAEDKMTARKLAGEEMAARNHAAEDEMSARKQADEEEIAAGDLMSEVEETVQNHAIDAEAGATKDASDAINHIHKQLTPPSDEAPAEFEEPVEIPASNKNSVLNDDELQNPKAAEEATKHPTLNEKSTEDNLSQNQSEITNPDQNVEFISELSVDRLPNKQLEVEAVALSESISDGEKKPEIDSDVKLPPVVSPNEL
ncbi:Cell division cycle 5-like protein [Dendrobium catenatum]|uniref:Cell division cycle 5-like protein n=1 Tax=Dendrobium catenatum TaxID=906689 RepID=A0A2I0W418_9ASPA|nr:Cell division cycle 5-like protein [Dendrobium catenatum]